VNHPTHNILETSSVTSIILVGPPASGKSTLRSLFSDYGVAGFDLEDFHTDGELDGEWKKEITAGISSASDSDRDIVCIEGAVSEDEVAFIRKQSDGTLVILVDVPEKSERIQRHVDRETANVNTEIVSKQSILDIQLESFQREYYESPYPEHDVTILNTDDTTTKQLSRRCGRIVSLLSGDDSITVPGE